MAFSELEEWLDKHDDMYSPAKLLLRNSDVFGESKRLLIQWQEDDGEQTYQLYFHSFDADKGTAENWTCGYRTPIRGRTKLLFAYCDTETPENEAGVILGVTATFDDGDKYDFIITSEEPEEDE